MLDPTLTAADVLAALHHDALYLVLATAFVTVGLIAAVFFALGRHKDTLLLFFALFATAYGTRLWLQSDLLGLLYSSEAFHRLREAMSFIVPIPAIYYFEASGFLPFRRRLGHFLTAAFSLLIIGTLAVGPLPIFRHTENVIVIFFALALSVFVVHSLTRPAPSPDFVLIRRALLVFVAFVLIDNIGGAFNHHPNIEPIGFVFFLATLGFVAVRQSLHRDYQFGEIQKELEIARRIQTAILPRAFPQNPHFTVAARYLPMTSVAGDFYDFLPTPPTQAALLIADVSGHGVPAALIASMVKLAAAAQSAHIADPAAVLHGMNTALLGNTQSQFVTAAFVHLDAVQGTLRYAAAAHPPMLLLRNGEVLSIEENGLMLAAFSFATYTTRDLPLQPGDRILLYTDGLPEAANAQREEFGSTRLAATLQQTTALPATEAADHIITTIQQWSAQQDDDLTVLICDVLPNPAASQPNAA